MMRVFFAPVTSEYGVEGAAVADDVELADAIAVFVDTELVSTDDANEARRHVTAGDDNFADRWTRSLRAV